MKKFISAASAMAMVASLVGSAIPFAAVAAEASKTVELRPYLNKDGSAASTTISAADIAAGDVTIPVALYYVEKTNDTKSIRASFGISSKDGDASNDYVTFGTPQNIAYKPGSSEYFTSEQKVVTPDGEFDYALIPGWEGYMESGRSGSDFFTLGSYLCNLDLKQNSQNFPNAWGSFVWAQPVEGGGAYEWTGSASDDYPCMVFDVNFAKGTPAGTYTIDFINMVPDEKFPNVYSTMIESNEPGLLYATAKDNLTCKSLTITIEGKSSGTTKPTTTTTKPDTTKPTTTKPIEDVTADFTVKGSTLEYNLGDEYKDAYLDFTVQSGGHLGSTLAAEVSDLPAGITYKITEKNLAIPGKPAWSLMGSTYYCECRDGLENPQAFKDGDIVLTLTLTIPSDIKAGEYEIDLDRFHVVEQGSQQGGEIVEFDAKVVPGKVVIKGEDKVTTTTAPEPDDKVTTTTTTPVPADVLYGDSNCDGKVNIADVVVLNKWLNDNSAYNLTAQGKINADCCDAKAGTPDENDSKAIIQSLVSLVTLDCKSADLK
jgi:hypothetical protein